MNTRSRQAFLFLLAITFAASCFAQNAKSSAANTLIVPGESIGGIHLGSGPGPEGDAVIKRLGDPDESDSALGGQGSEVWYLGANHADKGRQFHRPGEIGIYTLWDKAHDSAEHPGKVTTKAIDTTSSRFHTREGIAVGAILEAIRAKFPALQPDYAYQANPVEIRWPGFGKMEFYLDKKQGIAFAIHKSDGVCVQITVVPAGTEGAYHFPPLATSDYDAPFNGGVGDIKLGMSSRKLISLLGPPDEKRDTWELPGGSVWLWRVPGQGKDEPPGLGIFLWKLPDGSLIADQIRLTSELFMVTQIIYPGCPLKDALQAAGSMQKIDTFPPGQVDIYGALGAGILIDGSKDGSVCTAITIIPSGPAFHGPMEYRRKKPVASAPK